MHRILTAVLAFCLIGLVPFATSTSATAAEPAAKAADQAAQAPRLAKPQRVVTFKFKDTRPTYKFVGKVQDAKKKKILLTRSNSKKGRYTTFKTTRTSVTGNYAWKGLRKPGWYKVKVPGDARYATTITGWIHVFYV